MFAELRGLLARHAPALVVARDEPGDFQLETTRSGPSGTRMQFGAVRTGKQHVSLHLMAVYSHPDLLATISEPLRAQMQGKSAFNFTAQTASPELIAELAGLVDAGLARYRADKLA